MNLIKSHACGTGERVPNDIVKIMMLLKIQSLSYGYSGCKLDTVMRLIQFFNNDIYPVVYKQGSLGASGDLVPLAHLCLPLIGLGEVEFQGRVIPGAEMLRKKRWKPIELASKEGLALLNGTQNMSAFAVWALLQAQRLSAWADKIAAMSLDAYDGRIEPFTHAVHAVRPHLGQIETAKRMRELLEGSQIIGPDDKRELILRLFFAEGVQRFDRVLGRRHSELYVQHFHFELGVPFHGFLRRLVPLLPGRLFLTFLERVHGRDNKIHCIEPGLLREVPHNGKVPFVQGIERSAVNCNLHDLQRVSI